MRKRREVSEKKQNKKKLPQLMLMFFFSQSIYSFLFSSVFALFLLPSCVPALAASVASTAGRGLLQNVGRWGWG